MSNDEFDKLEKMESDTLRARFNKEKSWLEAHVARTFEHSMNRNIFSVTISQEAPYRSIEIRSKTPTKAKQLWETLLRITRFCMLFDGEFLKLVSSEFQLKNRKTEWSDKIAQEYSKRRLPYYSSANFTTGSSFICPLRCISDVSLNKWIEVENKLQLIHPMALYGMSRLEIPADIRVAILIEIFEPLFHKLTNQGEDSKVYLQKILENIIIEYGKDIFSIETKKDISRFTSILKESRHRIFHINMDIHYFLNGSESILYAVKLSMLYRKVLLDFIGIDYTIYSEKLKAIVSRWNKWDGIADSFCKKIEPLK